jgi:hypothetical protein
LGNILPVGVISNMYDSDESEGDEIDQIELDQKFHGHGT